MNGKNLDNQTILNHIGGELVLEDGIYLESSRALGNIAYAYPNRCGRAEVQVVKKTISQLINEDERILSVNNNITICTVIFAVSVTLATVVLAIMSRNSMIIRYVLYFWFYAYLKNGFYKKSAEYYGSIIANRSMIESKKYNYAFNQTLSYALDNSRIPTYEEARKEYPYRGEVTTYRLADSFECIIKSFADSLVFLALVLCTNTLWESDNSIIIKLVLSIAFFVAVGTMMILHSSFINNWAKNLKTKKWFVVLSEKPFLSKPDFKHYDVAIAALIFYCNMERYFDEHIEDYQIYQAISDLDDRKMIITLVNGDTAVIYF